MKNAEQLQRSALRWATLVLVIAAGATFYPLWAPLVLAAWVALLARPLLERIARRIRGRQRAAGVLVVLLVVAIVLPLGLAVVSLATGATELVNGVLASDGTKNALVNVVSGGASGEARSPVAMLASPGKIVALLQEHGAQAAQIVRRVASTATAALLGVFVFVYAVFVFLVDGDRCYRWLEDHAPLAPAHTARLAAAFNETGRGLFVSVGLTGLVQGVLATITYFVLGVPRALVLGLLTCVASLIPSVGTALVWVPVAGGLALAGRTAPAVIMALVGVLVIGTVDNVLRPLFARFGKLELPTFVLLASIFGGLAMFGTWGVILGPLFARMAKEALILARGQE